MISRTLAPHTREHPNYWRTRPRDHNDAGLFIGGPQEAQSVLAALIGETVCPVTAEAPAVALRRQRHERDQRKRRLNRLSVAMTGKRCSPVRAKRAA